MSYMQLYLSSDDEEASKLIKRFLNEAQKMKEEGIPTERIAAALEAASAFVYLCAGWEESS